MRTSKPAISRGVVCPQPYVLRLASRPSVRELTRVCRNPLVSSQLFIAVPPPAKPWHQRLAVLSLVVIMSIITLLSETCALSRKSPTKSDSPG